MLTKEEVQLPHCMRVKKLQLEMQLLEDRFLNVEDNTVQSEGKDFGEKDMKGIYYMTVGFRIFITALGEEIIQSAYVNAVSTRSGAFSMIS
jgi:hypothetical protein